MVNIKQLINRAESYFATAQFSSKLMWFSRFAIFFDYFYFGFLKIVGLSPAADLVTGLSGKVMPFIDGDSFLIFLGIVECAIGIAFLFPRLTRVIVPLMLGHMLTTLLPLLLLQEATWSSFLVPTLGGQYIMKNIVLIALAINIYHRYLVQRLDE